MPLCNFNNSNTIINNKLFLRTPTPNYDKHDYYPVKIIIDKNYWSNFTSERLLGARYGRHYFVQSNPDLTPTTRFNGITD